MGISWPFISECVDCYLHAFYILSWFGAEDIGTRHPKPYANTLNVAVLLGRTRVSVPEWTLPYPE
jgi:hypothetical protein